MNESVKKWLEEKSLYQSRMTEGDLFYKIFLGNYCLNECCYKDCKYKLCHSAADIRIGDLWGKTYAGELAGRAICPSVATEGKICSKLHEVDDNSSIISVPLDVKDRTALVPLFSPAYVLPHNPPLYLGAIKQPDGMTPGLCVLMLMQTH